MPIDIVKPNIDRVQRLHAEGSILKFLQSLLKNQIFK